MMINGEPIDPMKFKTLVDILMGQTSVSVDGRKARKEAERIAKQAITDIRYWDAQQVFACSMIRNTKEGR